MHGARMARRTRRGGPTQPSSHPPSGKQSLRDRQTKPFNVTELRVSGQIRRVGNGFALLIPVGDAKKAGLSVGDPVDALIRSGPPDAFGLLKDLPFSPFDRRKEKLWRE